MKKILIIVGVILFCMSGCFAGTVNEEIEVDSSNVNENNTEENNNEFSTPLTEEYVISCLKSVESISEVSPSKDLESRGTKNCLSRVFFSSIHLDQDEISGRDLLAKGTAAGGSVEVYPTVADAKIRNEYLTGFDGDFFLDPGSHTYVGTVVIRTSKELSDSHQRELEKDIIIALKNGETETEKEPEEKREIETFTLNVDDFSLEIPYYWEQDKTEKENLRYYAEKEGKVAMLTISCGKYDGEPISWQLIYDFKNLLKKGIESSMKDVNCKVRGCEEFVSNYGEKGLLYDYIWDTKVDKEKVNGDGYWYCMPSEKESGLIVIICGFTENVEYKYYTEDFMNIIASLKRN